MKKQIIAVTLVAGLFSLIFPWSAGAGPLDGVNTDISVEDFSKKPISLCQSLGPIDGPVDVISYNPKPMGGCDVQVQTSYGPVNVYFDTTEPFYMQGFCETMAKAKETGRKIYAGGYAQICLNNKVTHTASVYVPGETQDLLNAAFSDKSVGTSVEGTAKIMNYRLAVHTENNENTTPCAVPLELSDGKNFTARVDTSDTMDPQGVYNLCKKIRDAFFSDSAINFKGHITMKYTWQDPPGASVRLESVEPVATTPNSPAPNPILKLKLPNTYEIIKRK